MDAGAIRAIEERVAMRALSLAALIISLIVRISLRGCARKQRAIPFVVQCSKMIDANVKGYGERVRSGVYWRRDRGNRCKVQPFPSAVGRVCGPQPCPIREEAPGVQKRQSTIP